MIQEGQQVTWTKFSRRGRNVSMSLREGIVQALVGDQAVIKKASGKRETVAIKRLRTKEQASQITEFIEAMRDSIKERTHDVP